MRGKKPKDVVKPTGIEWSDHVFEKIYWSILPRYRRPDCAQLQVAVRYFLLHYAQGSGASKHWQDVLRVLLMALRIEPVAGDPAVDGAYVLANEDPRKSLEVCLPLDEAAMVHASDDELAELSVSAPMTNWYRWCLTQLAGGRSAQLAKYFGCISLFLCRLITHNAENVTKNCERITETMRLCLKQRVNNGKPTPAPSAELCETLGLIFARLEPFAKQIVCRLTQRRIELQGTSVGAQIQRLQNQACYNGFMQNGVGLLHWFQLALKKLHIVDQELLDMLACVGHFGDAINVLKNALPLIRKDGKCQKSWKICRLLRNKAHPEWATNYRGNLLAVATFVAIANNISASDDPIWELHQFKLMKFDPQNLELAISIGQSIRRAVAFDKKHSELR